MALKIKGIDISRAQTDIDFAEIKKAGVKFVILRAGIGSDEDTSADTLSSAKSTRYLTAVTGM